MTSSAHIELRLETTEAQRSWLRLLKRINQTEKCWLWTGAKHGDGYGTTRITGKKRPVHRVVYELLIGEIPDNLPLDHICHNDDPTCPGGVTCLHRSCVNPHHLEPASHRENVLRGLGVTAVNASKTHCHRGHAFDAANTYIGRRGQRICRACNSERTRSYRERLQARRVADRTS